MAFGTFTLTGKLLDLNRAPLDGWVVIDGIPQIVADPVGHVVFSGPKRAAIQPDGSFSLTLPTDASSGVSSSIGFRVSTDLRGGPSNIEPFEFWARQIGSAVDLSQLVDQEVLPVATSSAVLTGMLDSRYLTAINVHDLGVKGDGTPESDTVVQTALNAGAGQTVFFPAGVYVLGSFTIPPGTWLRGAGQGATVLKMKDGLNADFIKNANGASDITITDLSVNGNKANQVSGAQCRGIYLLSCARLLIDRVHVYDVEAHGIHLSNTGTVEGQRISNCVLERAGSNPLGTYGSNIAATNATDLLITATHSYDSAKAGFRLAGTGIMLNGCVARRNGNGGIVTVSGENTGITVNGGVYADNGLNSFTAAQSNGDGIRLVGVKNAELNSVKCTGNQGSGVGIYNSSVHVNISGGQFRNNGQFGGTPGSVEGRDGISLVGDTTAVTDITISSAQCYDDQSTKTQQYGIRLRNLVDFVNISATNTRGNKTGGYTNGSTTGTTILATSMIGAA